MSASAPVLRMSGQEVPLVEQVPRTRRTRTRRPPRPSARGLALLVLLAQLALVAAAAAVCPPPASLEVARLETLANQERAVLGQRLGWNLGFPVCVERKPFDPSKKDRPARTSLWKTSGERWPEGCWVTVFDRAAQLAEPELRSVLAHETYHCYQDEWIGDHATWLKMPPWLIEGSARWVGEALHPTTTLAVDEDWHDWFSQPDRPLFERAFDALGLYGHLQDVAGEATVWGALRPAVVAARNGGSGAAYLTLLGSHRQATVESWAASYFRDPSFGAAWTANGPGFLPPKAPVVTPLKIGSGDIADLATAPYTVRDARLYSTAEVVTVAATGSLRVGAAGGLDRALAGGALALCTADGGCACPAGATWQGPELVKAPNGAGDEPPRLALTGDGAGAAVHVEGHRLADFCRQAGTAIGCALLQPADFAAAGVAGARSPVDHGGGAGNHYCMYTQASGADGGIELDVFLDGNAVDAEATWSTARSELTPGSSGAALLPGIDQGELLASPRGFSWLLVRQGRLTFVLSIPGGAHVEEQLLTLGRLVLERVRGAS